MNAGELFKAVTEHDGWTIIDTALPSPHFSISGMKFFVNGQRSYSRHILYFAPLDSIESVVSASSEQEMNIIFWTFSSATSGRIRDCSGNILVVHVGNDPIPLLTFLESRFSNILENQFQTEELFNLLLDGTGIDKLVTLASELLGNPIWVTDTNYKYLAMNYLAEAPNKLIRHEYSTGYLDERSITAIITNKMFERIGRSIDPIYFNLPGYEHGFLCCAIKISGNIVAFVTMYEVNRPICSADSRSLLRLSKILALELQKSHFDEANNNCIFSSIMNDLFSGQFHSRDAEKVLRRLKQLGYTLRPNVLVVTVGPKDKNGYKVLPQFIIDRLNSILFNCICFYFQQTAVILVSTKESSWPSENELAALSAYLTDCGLIAGVSNMFSDITQAPWHFTQALKALELSRLFAVAAPLAHYSDYAISHMIQVCSNRINLDTIVHPGLAVLADFDKSRNTDLYNTMWTFLKYDCDAIRAAETLGIHKNTIYHRLEQIRDLIDFRPNDGAANAYLWISYAIRDYLAVARPKRDTPEPVTVPKSKDDTTQK